MVENDYLMHHGVQGQKWYNRRYQNEDGTLTPLGREHYGIGTGDRKGNKQAAKLYKKTLNALAEDRAFEKSTKAKADNEIKFAQKKYDKYLNKNKLKKANKYKERLDYQKPISKKSERSINKYNAEIEKVIKQSEAFGMTVKEIDAIYDTRPLGERVASVFLAGGALGGAIQGATSVASGDSVLDKKYKVKYK